MKESRGREVTSAYDYFLEDIDNKCVEILREHEETTRYNVGKTRRCRPHEKKNAYVASIKTGNGKAKKREVEKYCLLFYWKSEQQMTTQSKSRSRWCISEKSARSAGGTYNECLCLLSGEDALIEQMNCALTYKVAD